MESVRRLQVTMLVGTGAYFMAIKQAIASQLGLRLIDHQEAQLADGSLVSCAIVGPLEVRFENRKAVVTALVLPGESEPLLGAIPMEYMDVLVDPRRQRLIVNPEHPYVAVTILKKAA